MKTKFVKYALAALASVMLTVDKTIAEDTVTISVGEWPPLISEKLDNYGIVPDIISAAFSKVNVGVNYKWYGDAWKRAMKVAEEGEADFTAVWSRNDDREKIFSFTDLVVNDDTVFFYHKDTNFDWTDYDSFPQDVTVGITNGYSYAPDFYAAQTAGKFKTATGKNDILNFKKLIANRIQVLPSSSKVGYDILKNHFTEEERALLKVHPKPVSNVLYYMLGAKDDPKVMGLIEKYNKGIAILRESGEFDQILKKYQ